jgi:hypothetical protein
MLRVPMANSPPQLAEKVIAALLGQVPEIANQVCDGMVVAGSTMPLKNRDGLGGPLDVIGFIGHDFPRYTKMIAYAFDRLATCDKPLTKSHRQQV